VRRGACVLHRVHRVLCLLQSHSSGRHGRWPAAQPQPAATHAGAPPGPPSYAGDDQRNIVAVEATALLELGRRSSAQPIIAELERRGYRDADFVKRRHARSKRSA